jgi:hypothetical protein
MHEFDTPIPKEARSVNLKYIGINKEGSPYIGINLGFNLFLKRKK